MKMNYYGFTHTLSLAHTYMKISKGKVSPDTFQA